MELSDEIFINAPRDEVYAALNDPEVLQKAIPGCEELEQGEDGRMSAVVLIRLGPLKARFRGVVGFEDVVALIRYQRDVKLLVEVETGLRLVNYQPGRITVNPTDDAAKDLVGRLGSRLQTWTGTRWVISVTTDAGAPTIAEVRDAAQYALEEKVLAHPLVQAVISAFPNTKIKKIVTVKIV